MDTASPAQQIAYDQLAAAKEIIEHAVRVLEGARDTLNREHPAREVAIAITETENGLLRVGKALFELTSEVSFPPRSVICGGYDGPKDPKPGLNA